jgi:glycerol uptake facilitator-like aquaporin
LDALNAIPNKFTLNFAGIFTTFPQENLSTLGAVFDQAIGTFLLITVYLAMIDKRNNTPEDGLHWFQVALSMGLTVTIIGMSFGYNSAYAINPARDFSPRLFTLIAGWGPQVFTAGNYFFWIPLFVPMFSAFLACFFYIILIDNVR